MALTRVPNKGDRVRIISLDPKNHVELTIASVEGYDEDKKAFMVRIHCEEVVFQEDGFTPSTCMVFIKFNFARWELVHGQ